MGFIANVVERVKKLFGKTAFQSAELASTFITDEMAQAIDRWAHLYANKAPWLEKHGQSIGLPASIAREVSTLVTLEMQVTVTDPTSTVEPEEDTTSRAAFIRDVFDGLLPQIQIQTEYACALGGIVFKPYVSGTEIALDFVQADDFYPVSFNSRGEIKSAIFMERKRTAHEFFTRMERHDILKNDYVITNKAYRSYADNDLGTEIGLSEVEDWADIQPETHIQGVNFPLFAYFKIPQAMSWTSTLSWVCRCMPGRIQPDCCRKPTDNGSGSCGSMKAARWPSMPARTHSSTSRPEKGKSCRCCRSAKSDCSA